MSVAVIKWAPWLVQKYMEFVYSYLLIYQQIFSSYSALKKEILVKLHGQSVLS